MKEQNRGGSQHPRCKGIIREGKIGEDLNIHVTRPFSLFPYFPILSISLLQLLRLKIWWGLVGLSVD